MGYTIQNIPAKSISYGGTRSLSSVVAIPIHYTSGNNDTAVNQGNYFKNVNIRQAGAHFFVDQKGVIVQSIDMSRIAWAIGGARYQDYAKTGGAKYYGVYNNTNTVSIELCDISQKAPSKEMIDAVRWLITYIQSKCPNAKTIIRHFDVTGKYCPAPYMDNAKWEGLKAQFLSKTPEKRKPGKNQPNYVVGKKYTLQKNLVLYTAASTESNPVKKKNFNDNAKKKDKDNDGKIDKGSTVTCKEIDWKDNGNVFMKTGMNGWLKAYTLSKAEAAIK